MCMVYGVERHAARRRRIASPRTCGAPRGCNLSETVLPLVIHGEMTWCAPRRRQRTRFCRCDARNRLRGPSLITRRRNSRGIAILVGASRLGRVSLVALWGSLSSAPSEPTARVHNDAFSSFINEGLTVLRLIFVSAPKRTRFCKIFSRAGRTTGAPQRDATAPRRKKLDTIYHMKLFLCQACRQTSRRRAE